MKLQPPPSRDRVFYANWGAAHEFCQSCGRSNEQSRRDWGCIPLSTHHFIKQHRAHEACVLLRLCQGCHDLAEGRTIRVDGLVLPKLTIGICRTLKLVRETSQVNWNRCRQLRGSELPELEKIPRFFEEQFRERRPGLVKQFATEMYLDHHALCGAEYHHRTCRCNGEGGDR